MRFVERKRLIGAGDEAAIADGAVNMIEEVRRAVRANRVHRGYGCGSAKQGWMLVVVMLECMMLSPPKATAGPSIMCPLPTHFAEMLAQSHSMLSTYNRTQRSHSSCGRSHSTVLGDHGDYDYVIRVENGCSASPTQGRCSDRSCAR